MDTGRLEDVPTAELLRGLAVRHATGCLIVEHEGLQAQVWFRGGLVYTASAPAARARLGDRLVGGGHVTDQQLMETLELQRDMTPRRRIGELLIERGLIDRETMRAYVQEQIADSVAVTLAWAGGDWRFEEDRETPEDAPLDLSVENLLMEGARRLEEWEIIRAQIGSLDAVVDFVPGGTGAQLSLTPDEWSMLTRIDGASSIREVAESSGYSEFDAARIIYGLLVAGVVALLDDEGTEDAEDVEEVEDVEHAEDVEDVEDVEDAEALLEPEEAVEPLAETPEGIEPEQPPGAASEPEKLARAEDRNALLREFAALDEDWGNSLAPPSPPPNRGGDSPPTGRPAAPPANRPAPPPREQDRKRGLFGRRRKD